MTTSVYVYSPPREVRPSPRVVSRIRSTVTSSAPTNHGGIGGAMTQSMHVSSTSSSAFPHSQPRPALPTRAARPPTGPTPTRPPRAAAPAAATERKREPVARRTAAAASSPAPSPAGRSLRGARGGMTSTAPVAPSPLTVATNQEVSSSVSSLPADNTPPAPPSEDSDAGFSEGSYERAGSEKSTPVHGGVEQTIEEEITPRDEHPAKAIAAEAVEEEVAAPAAAAVVEEEAAAAAAPLLSPPTSLHAAEVVELDYSSPFIDVAQTPVAEATLVEEEKKKEEQSELPEETKQDTVANEVKEEYLTVPEAVPAVEEPSVPQEPIVTTVATETPAVPEDTVAEEITVPQEITVAHPEERNLLVDFSQASVQEEKREEEEDRTPLVEEVTPIGERAMSLADELGGLFGGGKMEDEKKEEQSLIQIEKVVFDVGKKEEKVEESLNQIDQVVSDGEKKENKVEESLIQIEQTASDPVSPLSHIEDTVVNSLADELQQALGVVEKKEEEQRREPVPPSSSSPTPHEESGRLSAHPSTSSLPSGSSSGTESGESSPNTRRRRTEEKKAEMMKQSTILAMADSAAKERDERKARLAAIMNRTRAGGASTPSSSTMTTSMSASMIGSTTGGEPTSSSSASSVLAKIAHITSNPRIMQVAEKTGSSSDLRMGELPGAVPQY
ncbi:hypothetical protein PRIPAC_84162 [Pristionchus pacificus]|nr:hypothetical protein PRIPAC_84162 [Pristionchus pacificus]